MDQSHPDYSYEARLIPGTQGDNPGNTVSPISKRSMHWPFHGSISTTHSPIDGSEQAPIFPTHSSTLRRYTSNRSRSTSFFHRHTPSSVSRIGTGSVSTGSRGLRHGTSPSMSTIRTAASSSTLFPVPDYVANYIRGETPESMARRREERARTAMQRFPDIREGSMDIEEAAEAEVVRKEMDVSAQPEEGNGGKMRWLPDGWRATMSLTLILAVLMAVAAAVATALTATKHKDTFWTSESPIFTRDSCTALRGFNQGAHGIAAALGVFLVAGAGHAAQVLSAPSRDNVDQAHGDGRHLDIGRGLSIRNLKGVNIGRAMLSLVAVVTATGTLVALNAFLFTTAKQESSPDSLVNAEPTECSLALDGALLAVILIFLVLTTCSLIATLARPSFKPLLTIGDAIASFAGRPDVSVRYSTGSIVEDITGRNTPAGQALVGGQELRQTRWMSTISVGRWAFWTVSWIAPFALTMAALILSVTSDKETAQLTFDQPHWTLETPVGSSRSALALLTSLPQILVAVLYLSTGALLTAFFSARELGGYDAAAKAAAEEGGIVRLRVSSVGEGMQTTSMYATLPPIVSIILWAAFTAIGFLVSQSITLVAVNGPDGKELTGVGLTPLALIILAAVLAFLGLAILAMSILCQSAVPRHIQGSRTIASLCRSWGATSEVEEMREQPSRQYLEPQPEALQGNGDNIASWDGGSETQGTIASGQWMAARRR